MINAEKSSWAPSQAIEWLGFRIDFVKSMFSVSVGKLEALQLVVNQARATAGVPARQLASIIGKIVSMSLGLGSITQLMIYANRNKRTGWCQRLHLSKEALQELEFWANQLESFNGQQYGPDLLQSGLRILMPVPMDPVVI